MSLSESSELGLVSRPGPGSLQAVGVTRASVFWLRTPAVGTSGPWTFWKSVVVMGKGESGQVHGQFQGLQPQAGRCAGVDACVTLRARAVDYFSALRAGPRGCRFPKPLVDRGRTAVIWEAAADVPCLVTPLPRCGASPVERRAGREPRKARWSACVHPSVCIRVEPLVGGRGRSHEAPSCPASSLWAASDLLCLSITVPENVGAAAHDPRESGSDNVIMSDST